MRTLREKKFKSRFTNKLINLKNMWFEKLMGFKERSPDYVRRNLEVTGRQIKSKVNGKTYQFGFLEIPTLAALRNRAPAFEKYKGKIKISEVVGDVQKMHIQAANKDALFQAASQFNLLEMVGPDVSPIEGVGIYQYDRTQGPACAIACGAGTIYRNYFVEVNGKTGQTTHNQIDCLDLIGEALGNEKEELWEMRNGYALPTTDGLLKINKKLGALTRAERDELKSKLKIGLQWNTEVTVVEGGQLVSQAYCSALPVRYSQIEAHYWEPFARLVLEALYEATFYAALINLEKTGSNKLFLTLVGGGAFGNELHWILESLEKVIEQFRDVALDVRMVSYGRADERIGRLLD